MKKALLAAVIIVFFCVSIFAIFPLSLLHILGITSPFIYWAESANYLLEKYTYE